VKALGLRLAYHADLAQVQEQPALAALLAAADAPFDRVAWWQGLVADCGLSPLYASAQVPGGGAALMALQQVEGGLAALVNWYSFRWRVLLGDAALGPALLRALAGGLAGVAGRLTLAPLDEDEAEALAIALRQTGWWVEQSFLHHNHILRPAGRSGAAFLAGRPGAMRSTIRRMGARMETRIHRAFDADAWAAYEAIYADSWKPVEGSPAFLRHFAEAEGAAGRLRLGLALLEGEPVAAQLWTVEAGTAYIHKLAYRESARRFSPGTVLSAAMFTAAIDEDRVALIDYGTGSEPYKADWTEEARPRYRLTAWRPARPANWPPIARALARRLIRRYP